ncbi:hypothetical protein [Sphingomonas sp.]|uniref:hypothetical protein n=1 Tax=Sphingomonas sp. TaxID=28214 RepID=UPI003B00E428
MRATILLFHPDFAKSKANRALPDAAQRLEGVTLGLASAGDQLGARASPRRRPARWVATTAEPVALSRIKQLSEALRHGGRSVP